VTKFRNCRGLILNCKFTICDSKRREARQCHAYGSFLKKIELLNLIQAEVQVTVATATFQLCHILYNTAGTVDIMDNTKSMFFLPRRFNTSLATEY
jgi:hypothetical protein